MHAERMAGARGGSRLKTLLWLVVLAVVALAAVRVVPVYVNAYELRDTMNVEARTFPGAWPPKTEEDVQKKLFLKARDLGLPLSQDQIRVTRTPEGIAISTRFAVPVDLLVYQQTLNFNFATDTKSTH